MTPAKAYEEAYRAKRPPSLLQETAAQWLDAARDELQLAHQLITAGYEVAARGHAEAAGKALARLQYLFGQGPAAAGRKAAQLVEFEAEASERKAYSQELLGR